MTIAQSREVFLEGRVDDVSAVFSLVSSGIFDSYVTYQRPGARWFGGNIQAEAVLDRRRVTYKTNGDTTSVELGARPLRQMGDLLGAHLAPGQRAYGYLTFEVGHLLYGTGRLSGEGGPLAHLVVPEVDVHWDESGTTVRSTSQRLLHHVTDLLQTSRAVGPLEPAEVDLTPDGDRRSFEAAVADVVAAIRRRQLRKAIVSRRVPVPFPVDLPRTYVRGLSANTPARSFLLDLRGRRVAGFSPETVAEVDADGTVVTQPLAGTRPLRGGPDDERLREELRWDVKECYEHVISTRLACEEMGSVCDRDSVWVRDLMAIRERGTVQHLGSVVAGRLATGRDAWDAVGALFPAVTASGIPKRRALETIVEHEPDEREIYAGVVCMLDGDGGFDSALVLRSIFQDRRGTWLRAGAGIVEDSQPAMEFDETTSKLRSAAAGLVRARDADGEDRDSAGGAGRIGVRAGSRRNQDDGDC
jgi:salicylate synthetase